MSSFFIKDPNYNGPLIVQTYLKKEKSSKSLGKVFSNYNLRFFTLNMQHFLFFYTPRDHYQAKEITYIDLSTVKYVQDKPPSSFGRLQEWTSFNFIIYFEDKILNLLCQNQSMKDLWIKAFKSIIRTNDNQSLLYDPSNSKHEEAIKKELIDPVPPSIEGSSSQSDKKDESVKSGENDKSEEEPNQIQNAALSPDSDRSNDHEDHEDNIIQDKGNDKDKTKLVDAKEQKINVKFEANNVDSKENMGSNTFNNSIADKEKNKNNSYSSSNSQQSNGDHKINGEQTENKQDNTYQAEIKKPFKTEVSKSGLDVELVEDDFVNSGDDNDIKKNVFRRPMKSPKRDQHKKTSPQIIGKKHEVFIFKDNHVVEDHLDEQSSPSFDFMSKPKANWTEQDIQLFNKILRDNSMKKDESQEKPKQTEVLYSPAISPTQNMKSFDNKEQKNNTKELLKKQEQEPQTQTISVNKGESTPTRGKEIHISQNNPYADWDDDDEENILDGGFSSEKKPTVGLHQPLKDQREDNDQNKVQDNKIVEQSKNDVQEQKPENLATNYDDWDNDM